MNTTRTRASAVLLALVLILVSAFPAFAEGGDGTGGGDNHDKPLELVSSSISDGAKDVDPHVRIVLVFNKNVVNVAVRDNNINCFTVKNKYDQKIPIKVEMGDDQVDPSDATKRTVTVVPQASYGPGQTYVLTISGDLAAKNGRDTLGNSKQIEFTVAGTPTTASEGSSPGGDSGSGSGSGGSGSGSSGGYNRPSYNGSGSSNTPTTTTTTAPPETTTKPRTTAAAPPITAAKPTTTTTKNAAKTETTSKPLEEARIPDPSDYIETEMTTAAPAPAANGGAVQSYRPQTYSADALLPPDTFLYDESTEIFRMDYTSPEPEPESVSESTSATPSAESGRRVSPILLLVIVIALAAAAAAVIAIVYKKEKKG
ncbi:MAG: Ig-like domain-containing protein [Clostridia bacterium]|nr:Ig-like domain-containing protein [Clostridia bacterium]